MVAIRQRHGGLNVMATIGLGVTGLGVASLLASWMFGVWVTLLGVGTLLFAASVYQRGIAPRGWTLVWGGGMASGAVVWNVLRWSETGTVDEWGRFPVADIAGVLVGVIIMSIGLIGIGRWLRGEEPVDLEPTGPLAIA